MTTQTATRRPEYIPTWRLEEINKAKGWYFFEASAKRFFSSRISADGWLNASGTRAYFVTSEQFRAYSSLRVGPRKYTVRVIDMRDGKVNTVGGSNFFQAYLSRSGAANAAIRAALGDSN